MPSILVLFFLSLISLSLFFSSVISFLRTSCLPFFCPLFLFFSLHYHFYFYFISDTQLCSPFLSVECNFRVAILSSRLNQNNFKLLNTDEMRSLRSRFQILQTLQADLPRVCALYWYMPSDDRELSERMTRAFRRAVFTSNELIGFSQILQYVLRTSHYSPTLIRLQHTVDFLLSAVILFMNLILKASSAYRGGKILKSTKLCQNLGSYVTYKVLRPWVFCCRLYFVVW